MLKREDSMRRIQSSSESSPSQSHSQMVQAGVTQILLPPPANADSLTIQEYHPPALKDDKPRMSGSGSPVSNIFPSPTSPSGPPRSYYRTRSDSIQSKTQSRSPSQPVVSPQPAHQNPSPHVPHPSTAASSSTPPVPATFASIMNAYMEPPAGVASISKSPEPGRPPANGHASPTHER
jgi:hypothetical protein